MQVYVALPFFLLSLCGHVQHAHCGEPARATFYPALGIEFMDKQKRNGSNRGYATSIFVIATVFYF